MRGSAASAQQLRPLGYSGVTTETYTGWSWVAPQAFLVNAYNLLTLSIAWRRPAAITSIRDLGSPLISLWKVAFFSLLGAQRSLDDVEHGLLRGKPCSRCGARRTIGQSAAILGTGGRTARRAWSVSSTKRNQIMGKSLRRPAERWWAGCLVLCLALPVAAESRHWETDILRETFGYSEATPSDQPLGLLSQGCPRRDCIPSIDEPRFTPARQASHVSDGDLVLGLHINGIKRAYPTAILNFHEIVNDSLAGQPVAVTFCPLCGSGTAVRRELNGVVVEFGVSGLLFDSDLVMYDRSTHSLWQQITGRAFVGPERGTQLEFLPIAMTTWGMWRSAHPDSEVLLPPEKAIGSYSGDPYEGYIGAPDLMFAVRANDLRVHPKTVVHGIELGAVAAAVSDRRLRADGRVEQTAGGHALAWTLGAEGQVSVKVDGAPAVAVPHRMFWFAWYTFHPHTVLVDRPARVSATEQ